MAAQATDTYRCELNGGISFDSIRCLMEFYQPLITPQAAVLYLTMASEAGTELSGRSHLRLFTLTSLDPLAFDRALAKLEEFMLVKVWCRKVNDSASYIYLLNTPMSTANFAASSLYMNRFRQTVSAEISDTALLLVAGGSLSTQGYQDITRAAVWKSDITETEEEKTVRPNYRFSIEDDTTIRFDYEHFISSTSALVFPVELRTRENLAVIGKLATVYGLSADQMRVLVSRCVNLSTMEFNSERLRILASRSEPEVKNAEDIYSLSPVSFLQSKQNGAEVTMTDKKLIEHLAMDMNFPNEVINVMLEYVLSVSSNRLNPKFVDMVAGEWARDGIATKEQALLETKKKPRKSSGGKQNIKIDMPEYIRQQQEGTLPKSRKATQETLDAVRELQNKMKD